MLEVQPFLAGLSLGALVALVVVAVHVCWARRRSPRAASVVTLPVLIVGSTRLALHGLGYTDAEVNRMTPQCALRIVDQRQRADGTR